MFSCTSADQVDLSDSPTCLCCQPQLHSVARRIDRDLSRRGFISGAGASLVSLGLVQPGGARATPPDPTPPIVFENFLLFDGKSNALRGGLRLLVETNRIKLIATGDLTSPDGAQMINCGGRFMMPGLIDAHWHSIFAALPISALVSSDIGYIFLAASAEAERTLMRGFTTVRDLGGPSFPLKQAIGRIAAERRAIDAVRTFSLWQPLYNPKVLLLALNYLGIVTAMRPSRTGSVHSTRACRDAVAPLLVR